MNLSLKWLVLALGLSMMLGCASNVTESVSRPIDEKYASARSEKEAANYLNAIRELQALDTKYPFSPYQNQIQLDLIFCYYKVEYFEEALATAERFLKLNPTHPDVDYVLYMKGLTHTANFKHTLNDLFGIEAYERDPTPIKQAFTTFKQLITTYPDSYYSADARLRMLALKEHLAYRHLRIAQYYYQHHSFVAVVKRGQYILEQFSDAPVTKDVLYLMYQAYQQLNQARLQNHIQRVYEANYGDIQAYSSSKSA
jgi:outer membrane protein assembly factor BamD